MNKPLTFLCLASHYKGDNFLHALKQAGHRVILMSQEKYQNEPWPRESIDEVFFMPSLTQKPDIFYAVSYLARERKIDSVVALDDFDVETAGDLREHLRLPGAGSTLARHFRDKLAMRTVARDGGVLVPEFSGVFNYDALREFMGSVPPPWLLKPRGEASSMGIRRIADPEQLWRALDELGDQQSFFVFEQFLPGDVFHVDSLVNDGKVLFSAVSQYARPPLTVYQDGGVFVTRTLGDRSALAKEMLAANKLMLKALGMERGATHSEFLKAQADGQVYFIECASRVGGANIADAIEYASRVNLWREWANIEAAHIGGEPYKLPKVRKHYAGIVTCLSQQEHPDLSDYTDPEIVFRLTKKNHAGLIVASPKAERVRELTDHYADRFAHDFLMVMPGLQSHTQMN
ncbi:MAG: ATP-grasp domain-containing protein [Anaerolineales bacterium]